MWNQVLTFSNYKLLDIDAPKQETIDDRGFFVFALTGFTSTSNIGMIEYYFCWINLIYQTLGWFQRHTVKLPVKHIGIVLVPYAVLQCPMAP
ncbi:hypothetical protein PVAP13_7NG074900 [Panicum virgatum]|uniref:Uncharacterized protein n=1 Tax=Panicum virgatum TaxID=38727 RepID=A0A8T0PS66_PANVG|nr:hypothetical protein PVAP13_7NG074900 [Panicum virgatum]